MIVVVLRVLYAVLSLAHAVEAVGPEELTARAIVLLMCEPGRRLEVARLEYEERVVDLPDALGVAAEFARNPGIARFDVRPRLHEASHHASPSPRYRRRCGPRRTGETRSRAGSSCMRSHRALSP